MSIGKRLAQRTADLAPVENNAPPPSQGGGSFTSPGRLLTTANRIVQAEDRAKEAEQLAADTKQQLDEALRRLADLEANKAASDGHGVEEVALSDFVEKPGRRRILSPVEREELKANLSANKLVTPVSYRLLPNGKKEIVSGHNRIDIYRNDLGRTTISAVRFEGTEQEAELAAAFANLLAPSLPDYEKYRQFVRLQEESGFTRADIITASGLSTSHVSRILAFEKLPAAARDAIAKRPDRLGGAAAEEFAAIAANGHGESVVKAIEALIGDEKMTQKRALEIARPKTTRVSAPASRSITIGKKKLCDVTVRGGVVGLRFDGKGSDESAQKWAEKIEEFIKREIAAEKVA